MSLKQCVFIMGVKLNSRNLLMLQEDAGFEKSTVCKAMKINDIIGGHEKKNRFNHIHTQDCNNFQFILNRTIKLRLCIPAFDMFKMVLWAVKTFIIW